MENTYIPEDGVKNSADNSGFPENLYVDLQGDQRTRPILCATEFSGSSGVHKKKSTSFQITSVTVQGSRLSNDGGDDSADDLDESHTEDISSDMIDCSKTTDLDNDPLSSDNSNANVDDFGLSIASKQFIPVKAITSDPDIYSVPQSIGVNSGFPIASNAADNDVSLTTNPTAALSVVSSQVPNVNSLPEHLHHRFKVVKIVSTDPFKRGRWSCMDFTDPPAIHSEPKHETIETTDNTRVSVSFNTGPSENQPSVAQFYEFPVNQSSISVALHQQQQAPQSVYGLLLPVATNPGLPVTKVQNVGVQATPAHQSESVNHHQVANIPNQPVSTQSQATQSTLPSSNVPQLTQVTPNNSQTQGVYVAPSQPSQGLPISQTPQGMPQPPHVIPISQPTQQGITLSQQSQGLPISQQNQGVIPVNTQPQIMSVMQQSQGMPITQQALPVTQQQPVMPVIQQGQLLSTSLANQGISLPPAHLLPSSQQPGLGMPLQPNQGLPMSQVNQGMPAQPGQVLTNLPQLIPVSQPPVQVIQGVPSQQGQVIHQDLSANQPTQPLGPSISQPNQGITVSQQSLGVSQAHGPLQTNQSLPATTQTITLNRPVQGLPVTQPTTSLTTPQPSVQPSLVADSNPNHISLPNVAMSTAAQPVNSESFVPPSQPTAQHQQPSLNELPTSTQNTSNQSPLLDILPDTLGTKSLQQEGEESESASSGTNTVAIDNKIEQAMDLVKSHLMFAVREEVDVLKEKITELLEKITQLEHENGILKANATPEMLNQLNSEPQGPGGGGAPPSNPQQPPPVHEHQ